MKKFLSLLLSLCLLLGTLPLQVSAFAGDIFPSESTVKTVTLNDGSLSLQNEYIHASFFPSSWACSGATASSGEKDCIR